MTIRVALNHKTTYHYNALTTVHPQIVRLRPAPHARTPVTGYSLRVSPDEHFVNWQQDPHGNFQARYVFPKPTDHLTVEVDLVADMTVINPFDFFVEEDAKTFPFDYEPTLHKQLAPFLEVDCAEPEFEELVKSVKQAIRSAGPQVTVDYLVDLNRQLSERIDYTIRMEPGVQSPGKTLKLNRGSCRDSSWLMVCLLRRLGLAARFVSGYLIQLVADQESLDGPSGPEADFTDLHAWAEVFLPGAGWIGLDPTSGLMAGEGHIPLACTPEPGSAAPISGSIGECEVEFDFHMSVTRIHEDPRVTKPYTAEQVHSIDQLGQRVDALLDEHDVRLSMGGEPTFVSIDDMDGAQWNTEAVGVEKRQLSEALIRRLRRRFAPGGLLHFGQGKWYPGESLPRWALCCYWRKDGVAIWEDESLIAESSVDYGVTHEDARRFAFQLAKTIGVASRRILPAFEDAVHFMLKEHRLPVNVSPQDSKLKDAEERTRLMRVFERGLGEPVGYVMPLQRQWWQGRPQWVTGPWPVRSEALTLLPGDSPLGLRLPLDSLPYSANASAHVYPPADPTTADSPLPTALRRRQQAKSLRTPEPETAVNQQATSVGSGAEDFAADNPYQESARKTRKPAKDLEDVPGAETSEVVRTALCIEARAGQLCVFLPPTENIVDYLDLVAALEATAAELEMPIVVEGYTPPDDPRVEALKVTPDPGVIEVNTQPTSSWNELVELTTHLYEEARLSRLGTNKFDLDGQHTGTGGGNHVVLGSRKPLDSPFLRRPDLLRSMITFWNNHPSLSYLFSGKFIGPTSQAPRVDEGRTDALYELELAFRQLPDKDQGQVPPWVVDRVLRNLLIDLTGNTHRAEFCIDKLYSPDSATGRLGLLELRGFEMPPHAEMSLTQALLVRACIAAFWSQPYREPLKRWGTQLHDRFMLPHFVWQDFLSVCEQIRSRGIEVDPEWYLPHWEFRFPRIGQFEFDSVEIELRSAIEPWYVLGEEPAGGGMARFVDSSVERLQVRLRGALDQHLTLQCNGRRLPLQPTGTAGEWACGVRYRAWQPPSCLHPTIPVHVPLTIDLVDTAAGHCLAGCRYHVSHPAGRNYESFPVNANEAEARRAARFFAFGHTPGSVQVGRPERNEQFPLTLDLRLEPPA